MKFPIFFAHGGGVVLLFFITIPALVGGLSCIGVGAARLFRKKDEQQRADSLIVIGVVLVVVALFSTKGIF